MNSTDPHIPGRAIRLMFADPQHDYTTTISGTREEIVRYFSGPIDVGGRTEPENLQWAVAVAFLADDGEEVVSTVKLPPQYTDRQRVYRDGEWIGDVAKFGEDDYRCSSADGEPSFPNRQAAVRHLIALRG